MHNAHSSKASWAYRDKPVSSNQRLFYGVELVTIFRNQQFVVRIAEFLFEILKIRCVLGLFLKFQQ